MLEKITCQYAATGILRPAVYPVRGADRLLDMALVSGQTIKPQVVQKSVARNLCEQKTGGAVFAPRLLDRTRFRIKKKPQRLLIRSNNVIV